MGQLLELPKGLTVTISHLRQTIQGQDLINSQKPFILGGDIWQGFKGTPVLVHERQLTDAEIEAATDVDGSKEKVWFRRKGREGSHAALRNRELEERARVARQKERDELELQKLKRDMDPGPPVVVADVEAPVACPECGKEMENARKLHGHMIGAHSRKRSKG